MFFYPIIKSKLLKHASQLAQHAAENDLLGNLEKAAQKNPRGSWGMCGLVDTQEFGFSPFIENIYVGIDGTGERKTHTYDRDFENSHVRTIFKMNCWQNKIYFRGPTGMGSEVHKIRDDALRQVLKLYRLAEIVKKTPAIHIAGYSRGGAIAISLANKLNNLDIPVNKMVLFDAVDRSGLDNVDSIPGNVQICAHAMRDPDANSRDYFSNCGTSGKLIKRRFFGTHGAMGGTPWQGFEGRLIEETLPTGITIKTNVVGGVDGFASKSVLNWIRPYIVPDRYFDQRPPLKTDAVYV